MGNEACDADSVASSVALAYAASLQKVPLVTSAGAVVAPVINIPRGDLALRQDIVLMLKEAKIDERDLIFYPEIPEAALRLALDQKRLSMVLTDHNQLGVAQQWLSPCVSGIVDHHEDAMGHLDVPLRTINSTIGSCVSLVAQVREEDRVQGSLENLLTPSLRTWPWANAAPDW